MACVKPGTEKNMESLESSGDRALYNFISNFYSVETVLFLLSVKTLRFQPFCYRLQKDAASIH